MGQTITTLFSGGPSATGGGGETRKDPPGPPEGCGEPAAKRRRRVDPTADSSADPSASAAGEGEATATTSRRSRYGPSEAELADCRTLGDADRLLSWYRMVDELADYKEKFKNCRVPQRWAANRALGLWVMTQRSQKKEWDEGKRKKNPVGRMTPAKIKVLEDLGFDWGKRRVKRRSWNDHLEELEAFHREHGHLDVEKSAKPGGENDNDHDPRYRDLAEWVTRQRYEYRQWRVSRKPPMSEERAAKLDALGFDWKFDAETPSSSARKKKGTTPTTSPPVRNDDKAGQGDDGTSPAEGTKKKKKKDETPSRNKAKIAEVKVVSA